MGMWRVPFFLVEYVGCRYDGDPFACLDEAEAFAGEEVASRILDVDPSLYNDVDLENLDDMENDFTRDDEPIDEESDPFDWFCGGCCDLCTIEYACIPVFASTVSV